MMDKTAYIAFISGGKDSNTMVDLLLKNNYRVDYIVTTDPGIDFPENQQFLKKLDNYFQRKYSKKITFLKSRKTYEELVLGEFQKGNHIGMFKGFDVPFNKVNMYTIWRINKRDVFNVFIRELKEKGYEKFVYYIGYAKEELARRGNIKSTLEKNNSDIKVIFPLAEYFDMSEEDCLQYIKENQEFYNPLYRYFTRTGCALCHKQPLYAWYKIYQFFYKHWVELENIEWKVQKKSKNIPCYNPVPFRRHKTTKDIENGYMYRAEWREMRAKWKGTLKQKFQKAIREIGHTYFFVKRHEQIADIYYTNKKAQEKIELLKKIMKNEISLDEAGEKLVLEFRNERKYTFNKKFIKIIKKESMETKEALEKLDILECAC